MRDGATGIRLYRRVNMSASRCTIACSTESRCGDQGKPRVARRGVDVRPLESPTSTNARRCAEGHGFERTTSFATDPGVRAVRHRARGRITAHARASSSGRSPTESPTAKTNDGAAAGSGGRGGGAIAPVPDGRGCYAGAGRRLLGEAVNLMRSARVPEPKAPGSGGAVLGRAANASPRARGRRSLSRPSCASLTRAASEVQARWIECPPPYGTGR